MPGQPALGELSALEGPVTASRLPRGPLRPPWLISTFAGPVRLAMAGRPAIWGGFVLRGGGSGVVPASWLDFVAWLWPWLSAVDLVNDAIWGGFVLRGGGSGVVAASWLDLVGRLVRPP